MTKLTACEFLSLRFDIWGTMLLDVTFTPAHLANSLEQLLETFHIAPVACVTDIDATQNPVVSQLNILRWSKGKPEIHAFPCICQIFKAALRGFALAGSKLFPPMREFAERLGDSLDFTQLCRVPDVYPRTLVDMCERHPAPPLEIVENIADLQREVTDFTNTNENPDLIEAGLAVLGIVEASDVVLNKFEADQRGDIAEVMGTIMGITHKLREAIRSWERPATAAINELDALREAHRAGLEPICSIAARLNPNDRSGILFEKRGQEVVDKDIIEQAVAFTAHQPPSPIRSPRSLGAGPASGHARLVSVAKLTMPVAEEGDTESKVRHQLNQYSADWAHRDPEGGDLNVFDYWLGQRDTWLELAAYALNILTRPVVSVGTDSSRECSSTRTSPRH
jgi:hypothetical protein